jgi:ABC-type branched-subunit amino acid transport system ATPase component
VEGGGQLRNHPSNRLDFVNNEEGASRLPPPAEKIRSDGITVFLIEHDMKVVMGISRRIAVLDHGEKIAEGTPEQVRANARVIEAFLGKSA